MRGQVALPAAWGVAALSAGNETAALWAFGLAGALAVGSLMSWGKLQQVAAMLGERRRLHSACTAPLRERGQAAAACRRDSAALVPLQVAGRRSSDLSVRAAGARMRQRLVSVDPSSMPAGSRQAPTGGVRHLVLVCCAGLSAKALRDQPGLLVLSLALNLVLPAVWLLFGSATATVAASGVALANPSRASFAGAGAARKGPNAGPHGGQGLEQGAGRESGCG